MLMAAGQPNLVVTRLDGVNVVQFEDRRLLDDVEIRAITDQLSFIAYQDPRPRLLLDFQSVEQISSAGLAMMISIERLFKQRNGQVVLANLHAGIRDILNFMRLDETFNVQDNVDDALKQFG
jgi:anti-sigma B factor antagonist